LHTTLSFAQATFDNGTSALTVLVVMMVRAVRPAASSPTSNAATGTPMLRAGGSSSQVA
jgi:hypothetical protein